MRRDDQVSYHLAPEYFSCLKFAQFALAEADAAPRWAAAQVGARAGAVAGVPLGLALIWLAHRQRTLPCGTYLWRAASRLCGTSMLTGCAGLLAGMLAVRLGVPHGVPACVTQPKPFLWVAWMHAGSYLGALLGTLWLYWDQRRRQA